MLNSQSRLLHSTQALPPHSGEGERVQYINGKTPIFFSWILVMQNNPLLAIDAVTLIFTMNVQCATPTRKKWVSLTISISEFPPFVKNLNSKHMARSADAWWHPNESSSSPGLIHCPATIPAGPTGCPLRQKCIQYRHGSQVSCKNRWHYTIFLLQDRWLQISGQTWLITETISSYASFESISMSPTVVYVYQKQNETVLRTSRGQKLSSFAREYREKLSQ